MVRDDFTRQVIQPQFWPEALHCSGKQLVVVGSGATAVTIVPAMSHSAAHVTMLQRAPEFAKKLSRALVKLLADDSSR